MTDPAPPDHIPVADNPKPPRPGKPKKLPFYLMWCYGLKVCVMFGVIAMLATAPLAAVNSILHTYLSDGPMVGNQPPDDTVLGVIIYVIVALSITPYLVGWMFYNAREWFEVDHPDKSIEGAFRPRV